MGRPETKRWVSPVTTSFPLLCLLVMWQGRAFASTIFPLNSNSQIGNLKDSSSFSWDFDDANIEASESDGEYANFFSEDNILSSEENYDDVKTGSSNADNNREEENKSDFDNSVETDTYKYSMASRISDKSVEKDSYSSESLNSRESFTLPQAQAAVAEFSTRNQESGTTTTTFPNMHDFTIKHSRFDGGNMVKTIQSFPSTSVPTPSHHDSRNNGHYYSPENNDKARRIFYSKYIRNRNKTDSTHGNNGKPATEPTMNSYSIDTTPTPPMIHKNPNLHVPNISGQQRDGSLQFKFPYRIPFLYVRRGKNEDEPKTLKNTNEESRPTDLSQRFGNGDVHVRLQRRNRSRRDTVQQTVVEESKRDVELEEIASEEEEIRVDDHGATRVQFDGNQQHKSSEVDTGSAVLGNVNDTREDQVVRDSATSPRPPPSPLNPLEVLQRLTRLLDRMLRELSKTAEYGQKFTLRLIRMTERQDIDQMQEIMRDFDISSGKPIFFIAGGIRKLNGSGVARVVPSPTIAATTNLTENVDVVSNETIANEPINVELPASNSTEEEEHIVHHHHDGDGTTVVPILRPNEISSLPVQSDGDDDVDDDDNSEEETTTVVPEPESELVIPGSNISSESIAPTNLINITSVPSSSSTTQHPLTIRRKRAIPDFDEFHFFPIPGRMARTENPYDDDDVEEIFNYELSEDGRLYDENSEHLPPVLPLVNSGNPTGNIANVNNIPSRVEMIDQSQPVRNDEISLNDSDAIIGGESSSILPVHTRATVALSEIISGLEPTLLPVVGHGITGNLVPPNDSIKIKEDAVENDDGSNDHPRQGEKKEHPTQTIVFPVGEHTLREQVIVENVDDGNDPHYSPSVVVSTDLIPSQIEDKSPISFVDGRPKADEILNLPVSHEIYPKKVDLDTRKGLELEQVNKSESSSPVLILENAVGPSELPFDSIKVVVGNSEVVTPALLPTQILQVEEERSFHTNSVGEMDKQNVLRKVAQQDIILPEDKQVETVSRQQVLSSGQNTGESERSVTYLNNGVVSENERDILIVPPTHSSPAVKPTLLVTDIIASSIPVSNLEEEVVVVPVDRESSTLIPASALAVVPQDKNIDVVDLEEPCREGIISKPQESNQNDPQEEIKANILLPQVDILLLPKSGMNIGTIKEILPTPNNSIEKVSLTSGSEHVPAEILERTISSKPTATVNNIPVENHLISLPQSSVAPYLIQTEESNTLVGSSSSSDPIVNPIELLLERESSGNEQTRNKQVTFTLGKTRGVGLQNVLDGVGEILKKVVDEKEKEKKKERGEEIVTEQVQVSLNQPNFLVPTVLEESQIIGNDDATLLLVDKMPIDLEREHVVVRGTDTVDVPVVQEDEETTFNTEDSVKNTEQVSLQNSENSKKPEEEEESMNESIVAQEVVDDNGEVRNPIETSVSPTEAVGIGNIDILSKKSAVKESSVPVLISQEPSVNVVLSPPIIIVPLTESEGTIVSDHRLNVASPSSVSIVPGLDSDSSKGNDLYAEKLPPPVVLVQEVKQVGGINSVPELEAVNDLQIIVRDVPKVEPVLVDVTNPDSSVDVPVDKSVDDADVGVIPHELVEVPPTKIVTEKISEPGQVVATDGLLAVGLDTPSSLQVELGTDSTEKVINAAPEESAVLEVVNPVANIVKDSSLEIPVRNTKEMFTSQALKPSVADLNNLEVVKVDSPLAIKAEAENIPIKNVDVYPNGLSDTVSLGLGEALVNGNKKQILEPSAPIPLPTSFAQDDIVVVPVVSDRVVSHIIKPVQDPLVVPVVIPEATIIESSEDPVKPVQEVVPSISSLPLIDPVLKSRPETPSGILLEPPTEVVVSSESEAVVDPILKSTPSVISSTPLLNPVLKPAEEVVLVATIDPVLNPVPAVISSGPLLDPVLKPGQEAISSVPLVDPGSESIQKLVPSTPQVPLILKVAQNVIVSPEQSPVVQPISVPTSLLAESSVPSVPGNENIIASLPEIDPDSHFGIKPIDTQPHYQIPGLRPTIPERPHPDYIGYISQGVDVDALLFSPPTTPVIVYSPPVFSGYSPTSILRKQEQMMKNYFNGLLLRRALPI